MKLETQRISPAPIRKSIRVKASQQRAFDVFVGQMGQWWPKSHSLLKSPQKDVIVEPRGWALVRGRGRRQPGTA